MAALSSNWLVCLNFNSFKDVFEMARRLMALFLVVQLLFVALAISAFADNYAYDIHDDGVSVFGSADAVTDDVVVLGDDAQQVFDSGSMSAFSSVALSSAVSSFGYDQVVYDAPYDLVSAIYSDRYNFDILLPNGLPAGIYRFDVFFVSDVAPTSFFGNLGWKFGAQVENYLYGYYGSVFAVVSSAINDVCVPISIKFPVDSKVSLTSFSITSFVPVEGISSGYSYNSGVLSDRDHQAFSTFTAVFGDQPAGDYIFNAYHWGQSVDVVFAAYYDNRYLSSNTQGGVTTFVCSHGGGDLTITGNFGLTRTTNYDTVSGSGGSIVVDSPGSWTFNVIDIVAVPLESAAIDQYGIFGPVVGFMRSFFTDLYLNFKFFLSELFGGDTTGEFEQAKDEANDLIEQELQITDGVLNDFGTVADQIDPSTITIPNDVLGGFSFVSQLFMLIFDGLGNYQVLVTVPLCIGIALICIGRGFSAAGRAMKSSKSRPAGGTKA